MGQDKALQQAFKGIMATEPETFIATVLQVNTTTKTVTVKDTDGFEFTNVRLTSVISTANTVVQYPVTNSTVLVSRIGDDDNTLFVSALSAVESIDGNIQNTHFNINALGYTIIRNGENLKTVLNDWQDEFGKLCDEINKIVVSVGVTPNVTAISQIKTNVLTHVKQRLNTILKP